MGCGVGCIVRCGVGRRMCCKVGCGVGCIVKYV